MSEFLELLKECLKELGKAPIESNATEFKFMAYTSIIPKVPSESSKPCIITVAEHIKGQALIYNDYFPAVDWNSLSPAKKLRFSGLYKKFTERNGKGVYFTSDMLTGNVRIEGLLFDSVELRKVFRHYYVEIANRREHLDNDLRDISEDL